MEEDLRMLCKFPESTENIPLGLRDRTTYSANWQPGKTYQKSVTGQYLQKYYSSHKMAVVYSYKLWVEVITVRKFPASTSACPICQLTNVRVTDKQQLCCNRALLLTVEYGPMPDYSKVVVLSLIHISEPTTKRHLDRFSLFGTDDRRVSLYITMGRT